MYQYVCDGCGATSDPGRTQYPHKDWGEVSLYYSIRGGQSMVSHHFCPICKKKFKLADQDPDEQSQADRLLDILTDIAGNAVTNHSDN